MIMAIKCSCNCCHCAALPACDDEECCNKQQFPQSGANHGSFIGGQRMTGFEQDQHSIECVHLYSETAVKARYDSVQTGVQSVDGANALATHPCILNGEDVDVDGVTVVESCDGLNPELGDLDLRSDDHSSTISSSFDDNGIAVTPRRTVLYISSENRTDGSSTVSSTDDDMPTSQANENSVSEPLVLRGYQKELTEKSLRGKNCLIVAQTGSGKTPIAIAIAQHNLDSATLEKESKVAFFVPTKALVDQQFRQFIKYLKPGYRCEYISGEEVTTQSLKSVVEVCDVIVMTPQILLNALDNKELQSLSVFSLLIFDECHHMKKNYPYNGIMSRYYVDEILNNSPASLRLPQVVGLTASPGAGDATTEVIAAENILELCANMNAVDISTVKDEQNIAELMKHISKANEDSAEVKGRTVDPFFDRISQTMKEIEIRIQEQGRIRELLEEIPDILTAIQPPAQRGSDPYVQFVSRLKRMTAPVYDQKIRHFFVSCLKHLEMYNNALFINADCRTKDALEYIRKEINELSRRRGSTAYDETDRWLDSLFADMELHLDHCSRSEIMYANPKLEKLEEVITSFYVENPNAQGIVFCKTREMTFSLMNWMKESPPLAVLNPHNITGSAKTENHGMTHRKLQDALQYFKGGLHKILVATSVAEEGLDVQKCNYVIRYLHVTNDIARIQSRGRARADGAQYVVLGERQRGTIVKDQVNRLREKMTNAALKLIDNLDPCKFEEKILEKQWKAKSEREIENKKKDLITAVRQSRTHEGEYQLRCLNCDNLCAWSADIRTVNNQHYIVVDSTFESRATLEPHPEPRSYDDWTKTEKVYCKECRQDWGVKATYKKVPCHVIKIMSFQIVDPYDKRSYCRKWKDVKFPVLPLSEQDMNDLQEFALIAYNQYANFY